MLLEFEKRLSEIAPIFLRKEKMNGYFFPIECDDGWFKVLKKHLSRIEEINNSNSQVKVIADQIKEKYGELNIYFHVSGDSEDFEKEREETFYKVEKIIKEAEEEGWKTCEHCGKPATKTTTGWITRLCDECYEKRIKNII